MQVLILLVETAIPPLLVLLKLILPKCVRSIEIIKAFFKESIGCGSFSLPLVWLCVYNLCTLCYGGIGGSFMAVVLKDERIDFRASSKQKTLLERAAELKHVSLSSYILTSSLKQAQIDLAENEALVLSDRDRELVMDALENPPEPNEALKGLFI